MSAWDSETQRAFAEKAIQVFFLAYVTTVLLLPFIWFQRYPSYGAIEGSRFVAAWFISIPSAFIAFIPAALGFFVIFAMCLPILSRFVRLRFAAMLSSLFAGWGAAWFAQTLNIDLLPPAVSLNGQPNMIPTWPELRWISCAASGIFCSILWRNPAINTP